MKTFVIAVLLLAVGLLVFDEKFLRANLAEAQNALADAQVQMSALKAQIEQLKLQVPGLQTRKSAPAAAHAPLSPQVQMQAAAQTVTDYSNALVIVEGQNAVGSGFICNMDGHTYIITNAHVLCDNPGVKITSIKGTVFTVGASAIAVGHDIVRMEITGAQKAFDIMTNADSNVKIGDEVTILGNSGGAGVVRPMDGAIVGLGPDLVEVDAPFVEGNSGSPIIHQATGKVLGLATYIVERSISQSAPGTVLSQVRRFGYRLDGIQKWEAINWQAFYAQSAQLAAMDTLSDDFVRMFGDTHNLQNLDPANYSSPAMQRSIRTFLDEARQGGSAMSGEDKRILVEHFLADLRSVTHADIIAFNSNTAYDYFRREVQDQDRFREELYKGLTQALQNVQ